MTEKEKIKGLIDEIDYLQTLKDRNEPAFVAWKGKTLRFLETKYGVKSRYVNDVEKLSFCSMLLDARQDQIAYHRDLEKSKAILQTYYEEMEDELKGNPQIVIENDLTKAFIVHGHDGELKESVARIIEKQGIEAIILSERANQGRTIIEKFEDYSDVGGAICLFTADDVGCEKSEPANNPRARQNVVFETGYFMGKLGRDHVVILAEQGVEMPSDLSGVVYTNAANWQVDLLKELKAMGYMVDFNMLF